MIQANDLRVGNFINFMESDTIFRVTGIHDTGINVENKDEATYIELDQFEGIDINEDVLKDAGFSITRQEYAWIESVFKNADGLFFKLTASGVYFVYLDRDGSFVSPGKAMKYVHELQNFYYGLLGVELNITM